MPIKSIMPKMISGGYAKIEEMINSRKALNYVEKTKPRLIFLNPQLFDESSKNKSEIKDFISKTGSPCFFITYQSMPFYRDLADKVGAKGCLVMPFERRDLVRMVKRHID